MFNHFKSKWRVWQEVFLGIDDLQGYYLIGLEKRVARLEAVLDGAIGTGISDSEIKASPAEGECLERRTRSPE